ncbi:unnamed protein product [Peronospora belbahrii]|uniref:Endonuclease/exonuclease/phosphatase domain-containing protein n=1 Tax=Peronospora belbahrii TaxID=622444 RepID=A0AAU9L6I4_9STRA|nr:unnamed protein product [Peronospora belbahrii]
MPRPRTFTRDRLYILVGIAIVLTLFAGFQNLQNGVPVGSNLMSVDQQTEAVAALSDNGQEPILRVSDTNQKETLSISTLSLKMMTFNLRFDGIEDGFNSWIYRKDHVADIIDRYHPVIMTTQEGLKKQLDELESLLKYPYKRFGVEHDENGEFEQIFYDAEVLELLDNGDFWLSKTPDTPRTQGWDAACVRIVTWGNHREESSKLLWKRMQQIAGDAPLFLMGDFNQFRHTSTYNYFTSREDGPRLHEAWPEAVKQIGDVSYTYHGWAGVKNDEEKNAVRAANHIDWILFRPQMTVLTTEVITESRNGRYPSDHYPILAEVLFPGPAQPSPPHDP